MSKPTYARKCGAIELYMAIDASSQVLDVEAEKLRKRVKITAFMRL
jgi:hypothetical protein